MIDRPLVTITLILLSATLTLMAPIFDSSIYGINGHPTEWLSFSPTTPGRHMGLGFIFSPFLHMNLVHLVTNMIFFVPLAMMIERKKSGVFLSTLFIVTHMLVLMLLIILSVVLPLSGKAFLGSSHVIVGLYTFWSLRNKNYGMLFWPLLVIGVGLWEPHSLSLLAHLLGLVVGLVLLFLSSLWHKFRPQSTN